MSMAPWQAMIVYQCVVIHTKEWNGWIPVKDRPLSGLNGVPREAESSFQ